MDIEDEEEDDAEGDEAEAEETEEQESLPTLPPHPSTEPSTERNTASQLKAVKTTPINVAKQSTIEPAVLRRVQANPVEPSSSIMVAHSPPPSPAQQSRLNKTRQTRIRSKV